jgi:hypothetical protein
MGSLRDIANLYQRAPAVSIVKTLANACTFFIGHLSVLVLLFIRLTYARQLFYREATASLNHLRP